MDSLYQIMREFLKKRGINAQEIGNGRLLFSVNGLNFVCDANDSDPHFLRLALPQINRSGVRIENIVQLIQQLNKNYKVAKIIKDQDGSLLMIADAFVYSTENAESLFIRLIQALTDMIKEYRLIEEKENGTVQTQ